MNPRHKDHEGNPVGCNAWCEPERGIHTEVLYGGEIPEGAICTTPLGRARVLACHPAPPEAPRSQHPACVDLDAWVFMYQAEPLHPEPATGG